MSAQAAISTSTAPAPVAAPATEPTTTAAPAAEGAPAASTEAAQTEAPKEPATTAWAKAERRLQKAKQAEERIRAREQELAEKEKGLIDFKGLAEKDVEAAARQLWGDQWYRRLTEHKLGRKLEEAKPEKKQFTDEEIEAKAKEIAQRQIEEFKKQQLDEQNKAQLEKRADQILSDLGAVLKDPKYELFELVPEMHDECVQLIADHKRETGNLLTPQQAADTILAVAERSTDPRIAKLRGLLSTSAKPAQAQEATSEAKPASATLSTKLVNNAPVNEPSEWVYRPGMSNDQFIEALLKKMRSGS
ncbi:MAG: hypothetical protein E6Q97_37460 [Desulfurellales bacterium]|nr:MAG: hypothetical protein E6Q97_37460 [Desulfurellales bacterium]